ncbi:MAG: FecR domain-containing protein [Spirochaetes bacterium]|nr:FecR domain-containing protein [Spirochaetota bacterium]
MRFSRSDFLVVGIGTAVIAVFAFLYYRDITAKVQAGTNELIGTVVHKRKTAERKYAGQVIWEGVEDEVPLYNYDSIRTSDQSEASLRLNDGTEIKLNENSMILLVLDKNQIDIQFNQGSIIASREGTEGDLKKLNIKSGNASISVDKGDVKLSQNKAGDLNFSVLKGGAGIDTGKGVTNIGTDQALVLAKDSGDVTRYDLTVKLVSPSADSYHHTPSEKKQMDFSWLAVKGEYSVFFELSKDEAFANILQKKEVNGTAISLELEKGIYYWRVRAVQKITKEEEYSESRRFTVLWDEPIKLISPAERETITYRSTPPIIFFKWTKSEIALSYRLVLASDPLMSNVIRTFDTPQNNIVLDSLGKGVYYWRVEKNTGLKNIAGTSPSNIFELNIKEKELTAAPELVYPENAKKFSRKVLEKQNVTFTWKNIPDIREYDFFVSKDEGFKDIVFSGASKVNFLQLEKNLPNGTYYWRVAGKLGADESTDFSRARIFGIIDTEEVKLVLPSDNAVLPVGDSQKTASVRFSWLASEIKGHYKVQVSASKDFSPQYKESILKYSSNDTIMRIEPGSYYWRVVVVDDDDSIMADSEAHFFTVQNNLTAPVIVSPKNGYTVNMSDKDILSLSWSKVAGANLYRISVYQRKKGKEYKIAEIEEKGLSCKITDLNKLDESSFSWTLQAYEISTDKKEVLRKSPLVKSNFKITLGPVNKVDVKSLKVENL